MQTQMDQSWLDWVRTNIERGCDKEGMATILLDADFHPLTIAQALQYFPQTSAVITRFNQALQAKVAASIVMPPVSAYAALDKLILPLAYRLESPQVHLYAVEDFMTSEECDELVSLIKAQCRPSTITNPNEPDKYFRTSKTCDLCFDEHALVQEIDQRMAEYMGIEPARSEGIQGQYYEVGEQFKAHTDYFEPNTPEFNEFAGYLGQRTWTFMIYLNEVEEGGETVFTRLPLSFKPKKGMAVIWNNLHADGSVNPNTEHWAKPVLKGEKLVITKWFRTRGTLKADFQPLPYKQLPIFTLEGFKKTRLPDELFQSLVAFYEQGRAHRALEINEAIGTYIQTKLDRHPAQMIELSEAMRTQVFEAICPMLEDWVKLKLKPSAVYGIREYQRGATLTMHVDRIETHQVSVIINVAQQVDSPWALQIRDHKARIHQVTMEAGDVLFYESARLLHGRTEPLEGEYFANIFAHTAPI